MSQNFKIKIQKLGFRDQETKIEKGISKISES